MKLLASNREDLQILADFIKHKNRSLQREMLAVAIYHKLMNLTGSWFHLMLYKILVVIRGYNGVRNLVHILDQRSPEIIDEWIQNLIEHILWGEDLIDEDSVGGFSQREMDLFMTNIHPFL